MPITAMQRRILSACVLADYRFRDCFLDDPVAAARRLGLDLVASDYPDALVTVDGRVVFRDESELRALGERVDEVLWPAEEGEVTAAIIPLITVGDISGAETPWTPCDQVPGKARRRKKAARKAGKGHTGAKSTSSR